MSDGANGRLSEAERLHLARAVYAMTGYPPPKNERDLSLVRNEVEHYVERIVREHTERAWDEAIHHVEPHLSGPIKRAAMQDNPYRAARQEQS